MPHNTAQKRREYEAKYRARNREKVRAKVRAHYHRNVQAQRERHRLAHNPDRKMMYWRKTRYGLTDEKYQSLLRSQDFKCAICLEPRRLQVDHNHKTGKVRGLLCGPCNKAIGALKDDADMLRRAGDYIDLERMPHCSL